MHSDPGPWPLLQPPGPTPSSAPGPASSPVGLWVSWLLRSTPSTPCPAEAAQGGHPGADALGRPLLCPTSGHCDRLAPFRPRGHATRACFAELQQRRVAGPQRLAPSPSADELGPVPGCRCRGSGHFLFLVTALVGSLGCSDSFKCAFCN